MPDAKKPREWLITNEQFKLDETHYEVIQVAIGEDVGRHNEVKAIEATSAVLAAEELLGVLKRFMDSAKLTDDGKVVLPPGSYLTMQYAIAKAEGEGQLVVWRSGDDL